MKHANQKIENMPRNRTEQNTENRTEQTRSGNTEDNKIVGDYGDWWYKSRVMVSGLYTEK